MFHPCTGGGGGGGGIQTSHSRSLGGYRHHMQDVCKNLHFIAMNLGYSSRTSMNDQGFVVLVYCMHLYGGNVWLYSEWVYSNSVIAVIKLH